MHQWNPTTKFILKISISTILIIMSIRTTFYNECKNIDLTLWMLILPPSRWVSHLRLCTVTKEEGKTRELNVYLLINSIACNELTTACRVWYLKSLKACTLFISYWLICQETRNEVEVNAPRLSVLGLFGFRKMTYTPRRRDYNGEE